MSTLLQIKTSIYSDQGQSSTLANHYVEKWRQANPDGEVIVRDLALASIPHLNAERFSAFVTPPADRTTEQAKEVELSDALVEELERADILVIALPMYNFGIPSTLKSWIDHVARAGRTFNYTDQGPVGLLKDRKTLLFAARGGLYQGTPNDTQTPYMATFLNFIGINDVEFIYAEGLAMGDDARDQAIEGAKDSIDKLVA